MTNKFDNLKKNLFITITLLIYFRIILSSLFEKMFLSTLFIIVPLAVLIIASARVNFYKKIIEMPTQVKWIYALNAALICSYFVFYSFTNDISKALYLVKTLSPTNGLLLLLPFFLNLKIESKELFHILDTICLVIVTASVISIFSEWQLNRTLITHRDHTWLNFYNLQQRNNHSYYLFGILAHPHHTLAGMLASMHYLMARLFTKKSEGRIEKTNWFLLIFFASIAILISQNITIFVSFLLVNLILLLFSRNRLLYAIAATFGLILIFSAPIKKVISIVDRPEYLTKLIPHIEGCTFSIIWNKFPDQCSIGEFHLLTHSRYFGLWSLIPLAAIYFWGIFNALKYRHSFPKNNTFAPFILLTSVGISSMHYAPIMEWGINIIVMISLVIIAIDSTMIQNEIA